MRNFGNHSGNLGSAESLSQKSEGAELQALCNPASFFAESYVQALKPQASGQKSPIPAHHFLHYLSQQTAAFPKMAALLREDANLLSQGRPSQWYVLETANFFVEILRNDEYDLATIFDQLSAQLEFPEQLMKTQVQNVQWANCPDVLTFFLGALDAEAPYGFLQAYQPHLLDFVVDLPIHVDEAEFLRTLALVFALRSYLHSHLDASPALSELDAVLKRALQEICMAGEEAKLHGQEESLRLLQEDLAVDSRPLSGTIDAEPDDGLGIRGIRYRRN